MSASPPQSGRTALAAQVEGVRATSYDVPTDQPEADGTAQWSSTTLVVVEVTSSGLTGTGWTYGLPECAGVVDGKLAGEVVGHDALAVPAAWSRMVRALRNATRAGVCGYALSAVDVALWDLKAQLLGLPLADLFGRQHDVPVYGSGGFTTYDDERTREQLGGWAHDEHIPRVKIKIGQDRGTDVARDLARLRLSREVIGPDVELFADANGAYTAAQAVRVMEAAGDLDVRWFEEPVSSDDLVGLRRVRDAVRADVAAGEYGSDLTYFQRMCAAEAVDCLQVDATRCGGYTEWFRAAAVAAGHHLEVSAHCAPHLHASAAAATGNLRHVEWFHDHVRIERMLLHGDLDPSGGAVTPRRDRLGHGLSLDAEAAEPYRNER